MVCELKKTLYGLKQAPKEWFNVLATALKEFGYEQSDNDQALWKRKTPLGTTYVLHYVDDFLIAHKNLKELKKSKLEFLTRFKGRDLGPATSYLNMKIDRDRDNKQLKITQLSHINDLLAKLGLEEKSNHRTVPISVGADMTKTKGEEEPKADSGEFSSVLGGLLYISTLTRPDISTACSMLARHMREPAQRHMLTLKGVARYLAGTREMGIVYGGAGVDELDCYTDADYATDKDTRKSRSGFAICYAGGAVLMRQQG